MFNSKKTIKWETLCCIEGALSVPRNWEGYCNGCIKLELNYKL